MDGYLDSELDLIRSIEMECHLDGCPACAGMHKARMAMRAAIGASALRYEPPQALKKSTHAALLAQGRQERGSKWFHLKWLPAAAALALAAVLFTIFWMPRAADPVEREIVDDHIRSLMANHLMDVPSTDQHTVKPWFAGKLDFSPPVGDFSSQGFKLIGGRVDYVDRHPAAVIVYQRNRHIINVFVWPVTAGNARASTAAEQGYNVIDTARGGMEFWIVSDLNRRELSQFATLLTSSNPQ